MLRAYDYIENMTNRAAIQTPAQFGEELKLAKTAAEKALQIGHSEFTACPGCHGTHLVHFFSKWGVSYLRCTGCGTIFCETDDYTLTAYQSDEALCAFRNSERYQCEAAEKRKLNWQEQMDWMQFRSFRYLGRKSGLRIVSGGSRYRGFTEMLQRSEFCGSYAELSNMAGCAASERAEVALSFNLIQQSNRPEAHLTDLNRQMAPGALLFLSARVGTGIDILVLREHAQIYPYEYVTLLSRRGLTNVLKEAGFTLLDYSTPGVMDVGYIYSNRAFIPQEDLFLRNLMFDSDQATLGEFQRFLQKSGSSSYAHIVARKDEER